MKYLIAILASWLTTVYAAELDIPEPLQPWQGWVLHQQEYRLCTLNQGSRGAERSDYSCAWPGPLTIDADQRQARFSVAWDLKIAQWVTLPGDGQFWPQDVRVNGDEVPVNSHQGIPHVYLEAGQYTVTGTISWAQRPQWLRLPKQIGWVKLQVDGQSVQPAQIENDLLVLGRGESEEPEADSLDLRVYRLLSDGVPTILQTVIEVSAGGQAREELIGPVLPPGFIPTQLVVDTEWPARLEPDGKLRIQVQPDFAEIRIFARATVVEQRFATVDAPSPWPDQEIWSYADAPNLRVSSAAGPIQIDPSQSGVPDAWLNFSAFVMETGAELVIEERSRGLGDDASNRLRLQRHAWLDFSGEGWTFRDTLSGQMKSDWRLEVAAPYTLESAKDQLAGQALLITEQDGGSTGVEWRTPNVALSAGLRMEPAQYLLPLAGWQQTFDAVNLSLFLPSGYQLIAAPGSDVETGSWLSRWSLLDLFICAVIALLAWKSFSWPGLVVTVAYLAIAYQQNNVPLYSLAAALGLYLLLKALPDGRLKGWVRWLRNSAVLLLVLVSLPFIAEQLRMSLYPQLEGRIGGISQPQYAPFESVNNFDQQAEILPDPAPAPATKAPNRGQQSAELDRIMVTGSRLRRSDLIDRYSKSTIVQAGRAAPNWVGNQRRGYRLSWSGPVTSEQSVRLVISPPWLTRTLRLIAVLGLIWLIIKSLMVMRSWSSGVVAKTPTALLTGVLLCAGYLPSTQAQTLPDQQLLQELKARLLEPPECAPVCLNVANADVELAERQLTVRLEVHAGHDIAMPLPFDSESLSLEQIELDNQVVASVASNNRKLNIPVSPGVRQLMVQYLVHQDRIALSFPVKPKRIRFSGEGWSASGVREQQLLTETLTLSRQRQVFASDTEKPPAQEFPPYVRVTRAITLGLDWTVVTSVERLAPATGGFSTRIPVLDGEKVLSAGYQVQQGQVELPFSDGVDFLSWSSILDKTSELQLVAPALERHTEVWEVLVSPTWRAMFSGVPETVLQQDHADYYQFQFHPLPGESLAMSITRPEAASGETQAVGQVVSETELGQRASTHTLRISIDASQGGERIIALPEGSELLRVSRDSITLSLRLDQNQLSLPVQPGSQQYEIRYRTSDAAGLLNDLPVVDIGTRASNVSVRQQLPASRWVLYTYGPRMGPAVLYWGELLVMLFVALGLARLKWTPLKFHHWVLLGIGFSTFSWIALAVVTGWLLAMAWRKQNGSSIKNNFQFDLMQLALIFITFVAAVAMVAAIPFGLLGNPDMHVVGAGSSGQYLQWFTDQVESQLPAAGSVTAPMWLYRTLMLIWALWLANAFIGWLRWAYQAWTTEGYWRKLWKRKPKAETEQPAVAE